MRAEIQPDRAHAIFTRNQLAVFRYLKRLTRRADEAEDLTQQVFVRALRSLGSYEHRERERAWLFTIARNVFLNSRRDRARNPGASQPVLEPRSQPVQLVRAGLEQAIDRLAELDRDCFLLRELAGLGYEDIARVLEMTPAAVRSRIHRARLELRAALSGEDTRLAKEVRKS